MTEEAAAQQVRNRIRKLLQQGQMSVNRLAGGNQALQRKFQRQINEDAAITLDTLLHVLSTFDDVSADWLLRGRGAERPEADGTADVVARREDVQLLGRQAWRERIEEHLMVPIYKVEASANLNTLMTGNDLNDIEGTLYVPGIPRIDGATHVRGDSMYPVLHSGDMIGFRIVPVSYDSIFYG